MLVSVVIPLYNKRATVARAIRSVLVQAHQDFEIIVINDGSTDGSLLELERFSDVRIRVLDQANLGVSAARNRGVAESRSELVAFLDADDEWHTTFLSTILALVRDFPEGAVFGTSYEFAASNGRTRQAVLRGLSRPWRGVLQDYFAVASVSDPPLWSSAVAVRKPAILRVGGFPEGIRAGEDLLLWARLASQYSIAYDTSVCSRFYFPESDRDRQGRIDFSRDAVGRELEKLLGQSAPEQRPSLAAYCAMWCTMRSETLLRHGQPKLARHSAFAAIRHGRCTPKRGLFLLASLMPAGLSAWGITNARHLADRARLKAAEPKRGPPHPTLPLTDR